MIDTIFNVVLIAVAVTFGVAVVISEPPSAERVAVKAQPAPQTLPVAVVTARPRQS